MGDPYRGRYGARSTGPTVEMRSPQSIGEMIIHGENRIGQPGWQEADRQKFHNPDYERAQQWRNARNVGYRAAVGRLYTGHASSGPKFQGTIFGLGRAVFRGLGRFTDGYGNAFFITSILINVVNKGPHYTEVLFCGADIKFSSGLAAPTFCGTGPHVVEDAVMNTFQNARRVGVWGARVGDYTPGFGKYPLHAVYTKPSGYTPETVTVQTQQTPFVHAVPGAWDLPVPQTGPMAWAPDFSKPYSDFKGSPDDTTEFNNNSAPWNSPGSYTGPGVGPGVGVAPTPMPGTQVISPTPGPPPLVTTPGAPPSRPMRRGKEQKFAGKKIMLRLLRLALAVTEAVDAIEAISDAIPDKQKKQCRRAARDRYWRDRAKIKDYGKFSDGRSNKMNWQMRPQEHLLCIYNNLEHLDLNHVMYNLVKNEIEDMFAGWQYGILDSGLRKTRPYGGPQVTKNPFRHEPVELPEWDDPIWDEVQDYLERKGVK